MISWSLPNAMFEPQKEIEPTIAANTEKIATYVGTPPIWIEAPVCSTRPRGSSAPRWTVCEP